MRTVIAAALLAGLLALAFGCGSSNSNNSLNGSWLATTNANGTAAAPTTTTPGQAPPLSITFDIAGSPTITSGTGSNTGYGVSGNNNSGSTNGTTTTGTTTSGTTTTPTAATNGTASGNVVQISNVNFVSGMDCFSGQGQALAAIGNPNTLSPTAPLLTTNGFVPAAPGTGGTNGTGGTTGTPGTTTTTPTPTPSPTVTPVPAGTTNGSVSAGSTGVPLTIETWSGPGQTGNHLVILANMNSDLNSGTGTYFLWAAPTTATTTTTTSTDTTATGAAATCQTGSGPIKLVRQSSATNNTNTTASPSPSPSPSATATPTPSPTSTAGH